MTQTVLRPGISLDAIYFLGFGLANAEHMPIAETGTIVIRYGGWSLKELREKHRNLFHDQDWYDEYPWSGEKLPSGIYALRLPTPDSNFKNFDEQQALLLPGEEPAPIVLAATAPLAIHLSDGKDPLKGKWTRCKEQTGVGRHVGLCWYEGRLFVNDVRDDYRLNSFWLSSARKID